MLTRAGQEPSAVDGAGGRGALDRGERARRPFVVELLSFTGLLLCYLLLLPATVWYAAYLSLGDTRWWMFVLNSGAPYLFLPVPLILLVALLRRRWGLAAFSLIPGVIFVSLFGQLFVPPGLKAPAAPPAAPTLTLLTYNLHAWNDDADGLAATLRASGADVLALQELAPAMAEALRLRLSDEYPYNDLVLRQGWGGLGVFSRVPVTAVPQQLGNSGLRNPQVTRLHLPWGDTTLINVHNRSIPRTLPDWPSEITSSTRQREQVARALRDYAEQFQDPVIAAGDFNMTSRSTAYELVASSLTDSWLEAGFGFGATFPGGPYSPTPFDFRVPDWLLRIDYVFHSQEMVATAARIGPWDGVSDHRPVRVELAWPSESQAGAGDRGATPVVAIAPGSGDTVAAPPDANR